MITQLCITPSCCCSIPSCSFPVKTTHSSLKGALHSQITSSTLCSYLLSAPGNFAYTAETNCYANFQTKFNFFYEHSHNHKIMYYVSLELKQLIFNLVPSDVLCEPTPSPNPLQSSSGLELQLPYQNYQKNELYLTNISEIRNIHCVLWELWCCGHSVKSISERDWHSITF